MPLVPGNQSVQSTLFGMMYVNNHCAGGASRGRDMESLRRHV